ncbi:hypothetical protein FNV43_RR19771 [Rhamnella rubrinervis]|uniref:Uncharacterized protein n=1 Tax=Rhamnella rubrinervis TaxID=2594499 RepID=A0A8K0DXG2_9ROSA|nr:hypothetical protein FNV43_RR19771 [Rhamnella rubrinervis]
MAIRRFYGMSDSSSSDREVYKNGGNEVDYSGNINNGGSTQDASGEDDSSQITKAPERNDDPSKPKNGEVVLYTAFFKYGLRLPLLPVFREILHRSCSWAVDLDG